MTARRRRICLVNAWAASNRAIIRDMMKTETPAEQYDRIAALLPKPTHVLIPAYGNADKHDIALLERQKERLEVEAIRYGILANLQRYANK